MTGQPYNDCGDTLALVRDVGVWTLGATDGCDCTHFEVQAVRVEVSCQRSGRSVTVARTCAEDSGPNRAMLEAVAAEVVRQFGQRTSPEWAATFAVVIPPDADPSLPGGYQWR